jgi:hypothetical protein
LCCLAGEQGLFASQLGTEKLVGMDDYGPMFEQAREREREHMFEQARERGGKQT